MPARRELYIYYRLRVGTEAQAAKIVGAYQHTLIECTPGLHARCLRRELAPGLATPTWMEVYAMDPGGDDAGVGVVLQDEIEHLAGALADCLDGGRHVEVFWSSP